MSQVLSDDERRELVLYHHAVFMPEFDGPMLDAVEAAILAKLADKLNDAERMDWLDAECSEGNGRHIACLPGGLRAAIDAMKEQTK